MAFLFKVHNKREGLATVYSVHCEDGRYDVHCEGGIYNMTASPDGNYTFTDEVPEWMHEQEKEISEKIKGHQSR
jgi:hypothetical protein